MTDISVTKTLSLQSPAIDALMATLQERFHGSLRGALLYGSCLRSGDFFDGLVDLYLVVDSYGGAYDSQRLALGNRLLAPNVFYVEVDCDGSTVRSKYAVVSTADIDSAVGAGHFESYFWGRFAQPMAAVYCRDGDSDREFLEKLLDKARQTFLGCVLPALPAAGTVDELWQRGLALSYSTELRAEGPDRARQLVAANGEFYRRATEQFAAAHPDLFVLTGGEGRGRYQSLYSRWRCRRAMLAWGLRRLWGKFLSVCRLVKALFTFDGGLDYIAWKLERHSGQRIDIPDKVRRRPLIHCWGMFWRLYRRGVFK